MTLQPGTITVTPTTGSGYRVRQDGVSGDMPVAYLLGTATVDQRVFWEIIEGRVFVFAPQDVS